MLVIKVPELPADMSQQQEPQQGPEMEISPIAGIRTLPVVKVPPADSDLSRVFDIENSSKPGDDSYSGSGKKSGGGQDDESEILEESREVESPGSVPDDEPSAQIKYFA
jgi:hypothetical protein